MDRRPLADCPGADTLLDYVEGRSATPARARVEGHVGDCAACRRTLSALAAEVTISPASPGPLAEGDDDAPAGAGEPDRGAEGAPNPDDLAPGTEVGRYAVLGLVGRGGMGAVYAARDPALHRKVALKLLRSDLAEGRAQREIEARLRREAQAMAQLAHPHVAAIYDVGHYGGRLFIAMEFIEGMTLARWLGPQGRPVSQVLERYAAAGRGLSAAHAAGLVHRDFKPQNVLVGDDGRVRVVDFGLARSTLPPDDATGAAPAAPAELASALTRPGALLGTPLYMAPELYRGEAADARSDQFSFSVALYEALYRTRPFAGSDLTAIVAQAEAGRVRAPPRGSRVPGWVRQVLLRGLSAAPEERFPSMDALLAELTRRPGRRWLGASGVAALVTIAGGALWARPNGGQRLLCRDAGRPIEQAWGAARREAVATALRRTGAPYAEVAAREATQALDTYAARWAEQRVGACEAARAGGRGDEASGLREACLDERRHEFRALVERLLEADAGVAERAVLATRRLPDLEACADARALAGRARPPDATTDAEIEALWARLAEARASYLAGLGARGLEAARPLSEQARRLGYRPLEAEALLLVGLLAEQGGDHLVAERELERAAWAAEAGRHDEAAARALIELLRVQGGYGAHYDRVEPLAGRVNALLERLGGNGELEAQLLQTSAALRVAKGQYPAAERELERALGLFEQRYGPDDPRLGPTLSGLGKLATLRGQFSRAASYFERALGVARRAFGDGHPITARALGDAASAPYVREGRPGPAAAAYGQATEALERAVGLEHPELADQLDGLAFVLLERGHPSEALAPSRRAASIAEEALGPEHPTTGLYLTRLASALVGEGRPAEALPVVERALRLARHRFGEEHARVAEALHVLGGAQLRLGRLPEARETLRRAHAMSLRTIGPDYAAGDVLRSLGEISLRSGQPAQALEPLEGALRAYQGLDAPAQLARTNALLARALWESGRDRDRASALASEALGRLKADARAGAERVELERWMRKKHLPLR